MKGEDLTGGLAPPSAVYSRVNAPVSIDYHDMV